jgi:hypothetical protein
MPPSLLSALCQRFSLYRMASDSYSRPLTLALSPGRGNRFVDAGNKFEVRALRA